MKSKFIDGTDATEYQAMIAPLIHEVADTVSETEEAEVIRQHKNRPLVWAELWAAMEAKPDAWIPTTEEMYWEMLEALPPAGWIGGAFLVGEPHHHDADGYAVFACFRQQGKLFHARHLNKPQFRAMFSGNERMGPEAGE
jgi:hypothetical protein